MPAWRRTHLHPGLYDEPVSERLAGELAALGPQAHLAQPPKGADANPSLEAYLGEAVALALHAAASHDDHGAATRALVQDLLAVMQRHAPRAFSRPDELALTNQWLTAVTTGREPPPKAPRGSLHAPSLLVPFQFEPKCRGRRAARPPALGVRERRPGRAAVRVHQAERIREAARRV